MANVPQPLKKLYSILKRQGYRPVIVGTYALILQGWLPDEYLEETKDIDIYIPSAELFIEVAPGSRLHSTLIEEGFNVVFHEAGGVSAIHWELPRPVELLYPLGEIFVPETLLEHIVVVEGLAVLEAHAVIVAKALGEEQPLLKLATILKARRVPLSEARVRELVNGVSRELMESGEPWRAGILRRRVEAFLEAYAGRRGSRVGVLP